MMNVRKSILYLVCALGMLLYALPRLEVGDGLTMPTIFGVIWIGVALLIIAAHLRVVLRVDSGREHYKQIDN
jgi:hypothetical protein